MEPIHGNNCLLSIKVDDTFYPVLCAIDFTFSVRQEMVLATTVDTGVWRQKRNRGLSEWSVTISGLTKIDNTDGQISFFYLLQESVRAQVQTIQAMFEDSDGNTQVLEGLVIMPEMSINANVNSFADASIVFEGAGEVVVQEVVSEPLSEMCEQIYSDTWEAVAGETTISGTGQEGRSFAGKEIIEVVREGMQYDYTDGAVGNRMYGYNGTTVTFEVPFMDGERVYVMWKA